LDDKYMSYNTILSELEMDKLLKKIAIDDYEEDGSRPDIAIVFSNDPNTSEKVDVVIVELKKLNLKLERKVDVVTQLTSRARKLLTNYPNKIQRIWFYGIVDIDKEFRLHLKTNGFKELYSNDTVLFKPTEVYLDDKVSISMDFYIQTYDSLIKDAEKRNSTFLKILKEGFKKKE